MNMKATGTRLVRYIRTLAAAQADNPCTDQQLVEQFATQREQASFAALVRRHGLMVLGVCRRVLGHEQDAEDVFQAAFLILSRRAGAVRQSDVGGFLYRVAYHLSVRARGQAVKRLRRDQRAEAAVSVDLTADVTWREVCQVVDEELQRL